MIKLRSKGNFNKTYRFLKKAREWRDRKLLDIYGQLGVNALKSATPKATGKTASSWFYTITEDENSTTITWNNSNVNKGVNIAIVLQYGHGTGTGGYVSGIDYINPALAPIFEKLAARAWEEVASK
jgi:hypothetical protein